MEEEDIYFFTPELSGDLTYAPFFRTYHGFYQSGDDGNLSDFDDVNIAEWKSYLGEVASSEDIRYVLYEANNDQILRWSLGQKSPDEVKWNSSSIQQTNKKKRQQFLKYLEITRRCNDELNFVQYYW